MTPDLLVLGTVHTLDPARPLAGALLARSGRILKLGTAAECRASGADTFVAGTSFFKAADKPAFAAAFAKL